MHEFIKRIGLSPRLIKNKGLFDFHCGIFDFQTCRLYETRYNQKLYITEKFSPSQLSESG